MLFLCDMQEKFRPSIQYFSQIVEVSSRMLKAAKILEMPVIVTEQYPKGDSSLSGFHLRFDYRFGAVIILWIILFAFYSEGFPLPREFVEFEINWFFLCN